MAKLSYNVKTKKFQVTELGRLIDEDKDCEALGIRQGFIGEEEEDEEFNLIAEEVQAENSVITLA